MALNTLHIEAFDVNGDPNTTSQRWKRWVSSFELFIAASAVTCDTQKRALLLHCAGPNVQDIFGTLSNTGSEYAIALSKLNIYFTPIVNVPYTRHVFRQMKQNEGETILQFVTRLRIVANDCDYGNNRDDFVRDQVIEKCLQKSLCVKFLSERGITLSKLLVMSQAHESAYHQANQMQAATASSSSSNTCADVNFTSQKKFDKKHKSVKCFKCGKYGHYANECRTKTINHQSRTKYPKYKNKCGKSSINCVYEKQLENHNVVECDSSDEYAYTLSNSTQPSVTVNILNQPIKMIVDSGASCNIIGETTANTLVKFGTKLVQHETKIFPYGSPPLISSSYIEANIEYNNTVVKGKLIVMNNNISSLLGKSTAEKLGVLKLLVNSLSSDSIENKYPQIISNSLGKLKNHNIKLHIDHSIPPVARKHYRIPFHLRSKVKDVIKRILKNDIIEPVENKCPTDWISPVIIVPKHNSSDIRICIDMRSANEAIKRTRHVTPTVDEIIASVNNCKVFSKIDLKMGYHQLQLDPECRNITTFSTQLGLYRYKRLAFGINSAADIFQYTIASLINDIKGVKNISDDIIVYGEDQKSHDLSLNKVLQRLNDNGLTINLLKCKFSVSEIEFFGFKFSEHGLSADPKKVEAVKSFPKPEDAKALRSFIGMATYSSRFIKNYSIITASLRELLKKGVKWNWTVNHDKAFQKLKSELSSETIMSYYDPNKPTTVMVDGSPVGLGAILVQDNRTIAYGSRALTPTESRYSQIEREALFLDVNIFIFIWQDVNLRLLLIINHYYMYGRRLILH